MGHNGLLSGEVGSPTEACKQRWHMIGFKARLNSAYSQCRPAESCPRFDLRGPTRLALNGFTSS